MNELPTSICECLHLAINFLFRWDGLSDDTKNIISVMCIFRSISGRFSFNIEVIYLFPSDLGRDDLLVAM